MTNSNSRQYIIPTLALLGLIISIVSLFHYTALQNNMNLASSFCQISETLNCDTVNASKFSSLFGIPIAAYGIIFYLSVILFNTLFCNYSKISDEITSSINLSLSTIACIISIILFLISKYAIGAICPLCLATYVLNIIYFVHSYKISSGLYTTINGAVQLFSAFQYLYSPNPETKRIAWLTFATLSFIVYFGASLGDFIFVKILLPADSERRYQEAVNESIKQWRDQPTKDIALNLDGSAFSDYAKGSGSKMQIVEFSDYECPFCRRFYFQLENFIEKHKDKVTLIMRNYPLDKACNPTMKHEMHRYACHAAMFARCAGEQGRFWEASEFLLTLSELDRPNQSTIDSINSGINKLSLDGDAMRECLSSDRQMNIILKDIKDANSFGLTGTPFLLVNGRKLKAPSIDALENILKSLE